MNQIRRLPSGGAIDRGRPLNFYFNGKPYQGFAGDTLASALLANDVILIGRSFKYHRPRGIFAAGAEEPNALVQLGEGAKTEPNLKATQIELYEGLAARSVNCWPSPRFDLRAINQIFSRMLSAGFYYKTFMWPNWHMFEPSIRRAAGLGVAPRQPDPDSYEHEHIQCDLLVVGGGEAGRTAARDAQAAGTSVILVDERDPDLLDGVKVLGRTCAFGYYDHNLVAAVQQCATSRPRQKLWHIRAGQVVLATGAHERPLVFPGNDRPGVMLASAVRTYLERWAILCGQKIVVFTNNDSAYDVAIRLAEAGASVTVVDARENLSAALVARARLSRLTVRTGEVVAATKGRLRVQGVKLATRDGRSIGTLACDLVAVSGGWSPTVHLFSQSGGKLIFDERCAMFAPGSSIQAVKAVGAAAGEVQCDMEALWRVAGRDKAFVDLQSDVTADDIALAARENYISVEHLKRYTTLGMGVDQGKTSNVNGLAIMGTLTGRTPGEVGTTKFRPPYSPVTMGALAGRLVGPSYHPLKYLPGHEWHVLRGAAFEDHGGWLRPTAYPRNDETWEAASLREATAVRRGVGIFDASSLGKIEIKGPDAANFLDHVYVGTASTLGIGRARYGLMLNEKGIIIDDGVFVRMASDHFLLHTTSSGAERIAAMLEEWLQCEWTHFDVVTLDVTNAWSTVTISGPDARSVLAAAGTDVDLDRDAFPHMHFREGDVGGIPARILRASFTGELSYEISVPVRFASEALDKIWRAGGPSIQPYGIEALMIMRTEKGYLHVGVDTDGTTQPDDVGMAGSIAKKQAHFIGRRSLKFPDSLRHDRNQLVGLRSCDCRQLPVGAQIVEGTGSARRSVGHVTSSYQSPTLGDPVALGMVQRGRERQGERVKICDMGDTYEAIVTEPTSLDPKGERINV